MAAPSKDTGVKAEKFEEFDYVIVGGGTAGLTVAARLSEDPNVTVGVIEAGKWRPDDDKIDVPGFISQTLMDPTYDWCLSTVSQKHSNDRTFPWPRGKVLGGSSALNYLVAQRGAKEEYDYFSELNNGKGDWNWKDFVKYASKATTFHEATSELQKLNHATGLKETHDWEGDSGPIQLSYSDWFTEPQVHWFEALKQLGLDHVSDGLSGENTGAWISPCTVSLDKKRSYAASAYYEPNRSRKNLSVLCDAQATSISLSSDSTPKATGVHFDSENRSYHVKAKREIIFSGGSVHSPQLLELSGIGNKEILNKFGIEVRVDNPNVGENLQEHLFCTSSYALKPGFETWDKMRQPDFAKAQMEKYHSDGLDRGLAASSFSGFAYLPLSQFMSKDELEVLKKDVKSQDFSKYSKGAVKGLEKTLEWVEGDKNSKVPMMEYTFAPGFLSPASAPKEKVEYISIASCLQHSFSRGSIHLQSRDPFQPPAIDPHYLECDSDLKVLAKAVKYCDEIFNIQPLKNCIVERQDPDPEKYKTDKDFEEFVKEHCSPMYHHVATCSMMSKEDGGVVNERLQVYGVDSLRVVDASVIPLHVSSPIVTAVYAIAEKAADMIKADNLVQLSNGSLKV